MTNEFLIKLGKKYKNMMLLSAFVLNISPRQMSKWDMFLEIHPC